MRFLRRRFVTRTLSLLMMVVFLQSIFLPGYAFALTTGPHQPEYISYESPGATDMVNLLTGDFTFSLPLLEVPGPEGGFALPLTYNAGIGLDQEASWVGLGWTMNAGAITRAINEFPDDASGESLSITMKDLTGVRGWTSSLMGAGQAGWNTEQGHYGSINMLGLSWADGKAHINPVQLGLTILSIATVIIAHVDASQAVQAVNAAGATATAQTLQSIATQKLFALGVQSVMGAASNIKNAPGSSTPSVGGNWQYSKKERLGLLHKKFWYWLDKTRIEGMYGVLNLDKAATEDHDGPYATSLEINGEPADLKVFSRPSIGKGSASDINYYMPPWMDFFDVSSPAQLAHDNFSVKAPTVGGSIRPYRLEIGSVSVPREMTDSHIRYAPLMYESYKVPFIYDGMPSSSYFHHVGKASGTITAPGFYCGLNTDFVGVSPVTIEHTLDDVIFGTNRMASAYTNSKKIPQANHIEYLKNSEIKATTGAFENGFLDYFDGSSRMQFRGDLNFINQITFGSGSTFGDDGIVTLTEADLPHFVEQDLVSLEVTAYASLADFLSGTSGTTYNYANVEVTDKGVDHIVLDQTAFHTNLTGKYCKIKISNGGYPSVPNGIGGFSITNADGMTYHFALPVYGYGNKTTVVDKSDNNKNTTIEQNDPFATTWLMTGITGPDFVDRGGGGGGTDPNGKIDENDWGYWVKLNYGKASDNFKWSIPFNGTRRDPDDLTNNSSYGFKQMYYLNSIETRSHAAIFLKENRSDSQSKNDIQSLALKEICLLTRENYNKLSQATPGGFGIQAVSGTLDKLWMMSDFYVPSGTQPAQGQFLINNSLRRIKFKHSYSLCADTPNSTASGQKKLTLDGVSILGKSDKKVFPDYIFEYGSNPSYSAHNWDAFGMYKSGGTEATHTATGDGTAWSLSKVTTPLGSTFQVNYERDTYSNVAGAALETSYSFFGIGGTDYPNPYSGPFVNELKSLSGGTSHFSVGQEVHVVGSVTYSCSGSNTGGTFSSTHTITSKTSNSITVDPPVINVSCGGSGMPQNIGVDGTVNVYQNKMGGNTRVSLITVADDFGKQLKTRYLYSNPNGMSSGSISQEPEYAGAGTHPKAKYAGYPATPVIYGKVAVLNGILSTDSDFDVKTVYEFETPNEGFYTVEEELVDPNASRTIFCQIEDHSAKIGALKSMRVYDKNNTEIVSSVYEYTDQLLNSGGTNQYQGVYSEGTILGDEIVVFGVAPHTKLTRTTVLSYPNSLKKITTTKGNLSSVEENKAWDFVSARILEAVITSTSGIKVKSITVPAHTVYSAMGSKATDLSNKNMLNQPGAHYTYKLDGSGSETGLLDASATIWDDDANGIWRKKDAYSWKGELSRLNNDGSQDFTGADLFNFASPGPLWQFTAGITAYDNFGMATEAKNLRNIYSSTKMDYGQKLKIAESNNAKYQEIAFSGAEDLSGSLFGGGVLLNNPGDSNPQVVTTSPHTGGYCVSLTTGKSFVYKPTSLTPNRTYRASVWTTSANGKIYYNLNTAGEQTSTVISAEVPGTGWYQINFEIPVGGTFSSLEVGVKATSGTVRFDDFRFQPIDAAMTCYVYDKNTGELTHVLNNNNLFTQYIYNDVGRLKETKAESFAFGVKKTSEYKYDYRRFHTNQ